MEEENKREAGSTTPHRTARHILGRLPLSFESNVGQTAPAARFVARGRAYNVFLTENDAVIAAPGADREPVRMSFAGANRQPKITPLDRSPAEVHYLRGANPSGWQTDVPSYGKIRYEQVYPGIDLEYYGTDGELEYDFLVAPDADPSDIQIEFTGGHHLAISPGGDLIVTMKARTMVLHKPVAYQRVGGTRRRVDARYVPVGRKAVRFALGPYDPAEPLVIDPVLSLSTYAGGAGDDYGFGVAVDGAGNMYVAGTTNSVDFPTTPDVYSRTYGGPGNPTPPNGDAVVLKLSPSGSLVYATYLGGSASDRANAIAVDSSGNVYLTGGTDSTNFPTTPGSVQTQHGNAPFGSFGDMFVTKLNATGSSLVYSTYLGGYSLTRGYGIAVDAGGNVYVTGAASFSFRTTSPLGTQPTSGGNDAFVAKINPAGNALLYSTLIGGGGDDRGYAVAVDGGGNAYATGVTTSADFPASSGADTTHAGGTDAFAAKLGSGGLLVYSTFVGGTGSEYAGGIAVDGAGNAYVTGSTFSSNFPVTSGVLRSQLGGLSDAYVVKYGPAGNVVYSTYLGGSGGENGPDTRGTDTSGAIAVDSAGTVYVTGSTSSSDFPVQGAIQGTRAGDADVFVSRLNASGSALLFSTYLGGTGTDHAQALAVDGSGTIYLAGRTRSANLPTASAAQSTNKGGSDLFVARISPSPILPDVTVDRKTLVFAVTTTGTGAARTAGPITRPQPLRLAQTGSALVSWTATTDQPWLSVSPASGTVPASVTATLSVAGGIPSGTAATAKIAFTFTGASTPTAAVDVTLNITDSGSSPPPVGTVDTPADGSVLAGSVAVTGWSLDNIGVKRVEIWRDLQPGEPTPTFASSPSDPRNGKIFIADATFVDGARPDVEGLFVGMPFAYRAGWGYLLLTWGLYNNGNGVYKLYAYAFDEEDHVSALGVKSVTFGNNAATKPFGSIDTPAIGSDASGPNFGWALTPKVNGAATCKIPANGVQVSIDSGPLQPVTFGDARNDIAGAFSGFSNSAAAGGHFLFDWSTLTNGPHTIGWLVTDDCNRADGIGSRYFNVTGGTSALTTPDFRLKAETSSIAPFRLKAETTEIQNASAVGEPPRPGSVASAFRRNSALVLTRGYNGSAEVVGPGQGGSHTIEIQQGERIEVRLPRGFDAAHQLGPSGARRALPIGTTWDAASGTLYWQPAPGFLGRYRIVFTDGTERIDVRLIVVPHAGVRR